jgi:hypothetical protein
MLADGGSPAVFALAPHSVMLADGGAPAVFALPPLAVMLADGGAPAVLACAPLAVMLAGLCSHLPPALAGGPTLGFFLVRPPSPAFPPALSFFFKSLVLGPLNSLLWC